MKIYLLCVPLNLALVAPELCFFNRIVAVFENDPENAVIVAYLRSPSNVALGALSRTKRAQIQQ